MQAIKRSVLVGLCCMSLPLPATAAVSEALCTAFTNAMAEFSAKLPMTVSMPSNATLGKVDKSNALVWLPTTYTKVVFDCGTGTVIYSLKPGTAGASYRLLKRSSPRELAAFKAIQDDMACKSDGFIRSHGVSEMRQWYSYDDTPWNTFTTNPEDCR